jgi:hypothetical protein
MKSGGSREVVEVSAILAERCGVVGVVFLLLLIAKFQFLNV